MNPYDSNNNNNNEMDFCSALQDRNIALNTNSGKLTDADHTQFS